MLFQKHGSAAMAVVTLAALTSWSGQRAAAG